MELKQRKTISRRSTFRYTEYFLLFYHLVFFVLSKFIIHCSLWLLIKDIAKLQIHRINGAWRLSVSLCLMVAYLRNSILCLHCWNLYLHITYHRYWWNIDKIDRTRQLECVSKKIYNVGKLNQLKGSPLNISKLVIYVTLKCLINKYLLKSRSKQYLHPTNFLIL